MSGGSGNRTITITLSASGHSAEAFVMEYSGLATSPLDKFATAKGTGTALASGTLATTTQASELVIAGLGVAASSTTISSVTAGNSLAGSAVNPTAVYVYTNVLSTIGTPSVSGIGSASGQWSGVIASFKAAPPLALSGSASGNYTLTGMSGSVNVSKASLTVTATSASKTYDGTVNSSVAPTISSGSLMGGDTAAFSQAFSDKNVGTSKTLTPSGTVTDGNSGNNYSYTFSAQNNGTITAKALTITASAQSKPYGTTLSLGTTAFSVGSGLVSPEAVTAVMLAASGGTSPTAPGGIYTITPSAATGNNGFSAANYNITYATGTLRVNPAPVSSFVLATTKNNAVTFGANKLVLLASDSGVTLSVSSVISPSTHGTVMLNGDNTITYTPGTDFTGSDNFNYTLSDNEGGSATGTVSVTVNEVNAVVLSITMVEGVPTVSTFAIPNYTYNLQYSGDSGSTWSQLTTVTAAANGNITYSDTDFASHNSRIFRLAQ